MLRSMSDLENYTIGATDGDIGHVEDFYFDDRAWVIRYLVVDAGSWLSSRKVLVSPIAIHDPDWAQRRLPVSITKEQVRNSPDVDTNRPVSRQYEMQYQSYYGYPHYGGGIGIWGAGMYPCLMYPGYIDTGLGASERIRANDERVRMEQARHRDDDPDLRSCKAVIGDHIHATDGEVGHVEGFLIDDETWAIRYIVVNTSNWWLGHPVLIAPQWIKDVGWTDESISVDLTRASVKNSPPYNPTVELSRDKEAGLHEHYGRPGYWMPP